RPLGSTGDDSRPRRPPAVPGPLGDPAMTRALVPAATALALLLTSRPLPAADAVDYARQVKPLLAGRCYACHGGLQQKGGLRLDTAQLAREGGTSGPAVVPGKSGESRLIARVT